MEIRFSESGDTYGVDDCFIEYILTYFDKDDQIYRGTLLVPKGFDPELITSLLEDSYTGDDDEKQDPLFDDFDFDTFDK